MTITPFEYISPNSLDEVLRLIKQRGSQVLVGDQAFVSQLKKGYLSPKAVVSLKNVPNFNKVVQEETHLVIGATTTYADLAKEQAISDYPVLSHALAVIGDPHVSNNSTIGGAFYFGGNLHGHVLAALLALDAQLVVVDATAEHFVPIDTFYQLGGLKSLEQGELIRAVHIPVQGARVSAYEKMSFLGGGRSICGVAVALEKTAGILTDIRIVLTGSTDIPVRLEKVESVLLGASITSNQVETALKKLEDEVLTFQSEPAIDEAYLRHLIKVLLKKSIIKL